MKNRCGFTPLQTGYSKRRSVTGFTLMELMIAVVILMVALTGLIATYVSCFDLNETARNLNYAMMAAQAKMEEIRAEASTNYDTNLIAKYAVPANCTFKISTFFPSGSPIADGDNNGSVIVSESTSGKAEVTIRVCWRQRGGRIIGGDSNLTPNANTPAQLFTYITKYK